MKIFINDIEHEVAGENDDAGTTGAGTAGTAGETLTRPSVADAVAPLGLPASGVAVALNECVVPRSQWASTELTAGDRLIVLRAAQGG
jgi:thiamine biosynthesis protein ThiS